MAGRGCCWGVELVCSQCNRNTRCSAQRCAPSTPKWGRICLVGWSMLACWFSLLNLSTLCLPIWCSVEVELAEKFCQRPVELGTFLVGHSVDSALCQCSEFWECDCNETSWWYTSYRILFLGTQCLVWSTKAQADGGSLGVLHPLPGATGRAETLIGKFFRIYRCSRWEGGQCQAFAEVRLLDVTLLWTLLSVLVSERLEHCSIIAELDFRWFWQVPHTFQGRKMSTLEVGPVFQTLRLQTLRSTNLQTSFTSLPQQHICFLYHADYDGFSQSPWSLALVLFFEHLKQEAYNDTARRLLWYVQCPGYEDSVEPGWTVWSVESLKHHQQLGRTCLRQTRTTFEALPRSLGDVENAWEEEV